MIGYFFDKTQKQFRVVAPGVNLLVPHGGDPLSFAEMVRSTAASSGVDLPVVAL